MPRGGGRGRGRGEARWSSKTGFEESGGYMKAKISKLDNQFKSGAQEEVGGEQKEKGIFHGIGIMVDGYTDPSSDTLKRFMMVHGGIYHQYFSNRVTHIITKNLPDSKVKRLKGNEPICTPNWITESIQAGKLLDFKKYLLYSSQSKTQPRLQFKPVVSEPEDNKPKDATDPGFVKDFYNKSRLHHVSEMGANFKRYVNELRDAHDGDFPARKELIVEKLNEDFTPSMIMHIDMDCFFVSVGLRSRPDLVGQPVGVAHAKEGNSSKVLTEEEAEARKKEMDFYRKRAGQPVSEEKADKTEFSSMSELSSVSYEARAKGVKGGMFLGPALKLCPELKTIPYDFPGYEEVSKVLYDTVAKYTLDIQATSCDEMVVDLTDLLNSTGIHALDFAEKLREEIFEKTACRASVGLGPTKLLARMAVKKAKPNGKFFLSQEAAKEFMRELPVTDLPTVGRKIGQRLRELFVETCGNLLDVPVATLTSEFGEKTGLAIREYAQGIDKRSLNLVQERKSVTCDMNYGIRFKTEDDCTKLLTQLCDAVVEKMTKLRVRGKCVTLKFMMRAEGAPKITSKHMGHGACTSTSKSVAMVSATDRATVIRREVLLLLRLMKLDVKDMRGVGITLSKLEGDTTGVGRKSTAGGAPKKGSIVNWMTTTEGEGDNNKKQWPYNSFDKPSTESIFGAVISAPVAGGFGSPAISAQGVVEKVDPSFLAALPKDLRREVEMGLPQGLTLPKIPLSPINKSTVASTSNVNHHPNYADIDPETLAAMPPDIQEELKRGSNFSDPRSSRSTASNNIVITNKDIENTFENGYSASTANIFENMMRADAMSPSPKKSPVLGKKRGRPPKNSPRFNKSSKGSKSKSPARKKLFSPKEEEENIPVNVVETVTKIEPNIKGQSSEADIRSLLKGWLAKTDNPSNGDINTFSKFMAEITALGELAKVSCLMRTLRAGVDWRRTKRWEKAWQDVNGMVQAAAIAYYDVQIQF